MGKLKYVVIASQDPAETARFYREVFELKQVGKVNGDNAEGVYLSDGDVSIAIVKFKNDEVAGPEFGVGYSGLHHIGFQVDDLSEIDGRLRSADARAREDADSALASEMGRGHGGRNAALHYTGPDGVLIDVSQEGWVGGGSKRVKKPAPSNNGETPQPERATRRV